MMSTTYHYQVMMLGAPDERASFVKAGVEQRAADLGLPDGAIRFLDEADAALRDLKLPTVALFFGSPAVTSESKILKDLLEDSAAIIPVVSDLKSVSDEIPKQISHINAIEAHLNGFGIDRISSLILESFRILRAERRIFISYKREDSQPLAERLYDRLDSRGFDVFIDLRSVPPASDFQSVLWHRLADSDVVVLIDTTNFRASRWTTLELAQANATNIQILHLLWPGQKEDGASSFSNFKKLHPSDFNGPSGRGENVLESTLDAICDEAERLRARAIAARYRYLVDNFCDAARDAGLSPVVQPDRWISLRGTKVGDLAVVPAIGVPTSDKINTIFEAITLAAPAIGQIWVLFDNRGIQASWLGHLDWLSSHLPVKSIRMALAPASLKEL